MARQRGRWVLQEGQEHRAEGAQQGRAPTQRPLHSLELGSVMAATREVAWKPACAQHIPEPCHPESQPLCLPGPPTARQPLLTGDAFPIMSLGRHEPH